MLYPPAMLPPGFEWRHFIDAPALYLNGKQVAILAPLESGYRVTLRPNHADMRHRFLASEEVAMRFVERWVELREGEIRKG